MEFKTQTNQPAAQPAAQSVPQVARPSGNAGRSMHNGGNGGGRKLVAVILSVVVVLALVAAGLFLLLTQKGSQDSAIDKNKFQAVFMTNGQVYFGHLASTAGEYVELTDIYYLQVQQEVQPSANKNTQQSENTNSQVSLTKLGKELHGPTDKMNISKDQILFWEDLKDDSSVVKAINDNKNR